MKKVLVIDDTSKLTMLGSNQTNYKYKDPCPEILETFANQYPKGDYEVVLEFPEFTSLCPKTGQPDFATIKIIYVPGKKCLESKSIKLYMFAFRNHGSFMETITNKILNDCVEACDPVYMRVEGIFNARGGLKIDVHAQYWKQTKEGR